MSAAVQDALHSSCHEAHYELWVKAKADDWGLADLVYGEV